MMDIKLLKEKIENSGMTITSISEKAGISRETLYNRMKKPDFKASEISALTEVLHLEKEERDVIFFSR